MRRFIFLFFIPLFAAAIPYELNFVGLKDPAVLKAMFDVSDLVLLQDRPPASINGLRYRIASDIPQLLKVLRAYGYYDATVTSDVENEKDGLQVYIFIHPGVPYQLKSYAVFHGDGCKEFAEVPGCDPFTPASLDLKVGEPARSVDIVNAELKLLNNLASCGYPLATVEKRRVEVDMATKSVDAAACIDEGPLSKFGPISIFGVSGVKPRYIQRRVAWKEGEIYNPDAIEDTQKRLLNSNLFSSVLVTHDEKLDSEGELPMKLRLTEAKHKQFSVGAYYATVDGPGVTFGWTNRNVRGMGEIVHFDGNFSKRYISGSVSYKKPDYIVMDLLYTSTVALSRESIRAYTAFTYEFDNFFEWKLGPEKSFSVGLEAQHINVSRSATNGTYLLVGLPVFAKYNRADNLLDPTRGYSLVYQGIPYQSLEEANQHFVKQRVTGAFYIPIFTKNFVLATRAQFGSIAGTRQENIPLPKLFLGGSEDDLRGYRYKTVSPLNEDNKPLGGRSAIFISVEARMRFNKTIGLVPFADFGTVTFDELPQVDAKWYKSVGIGLRYFTYFGPLRVDVGFPLDRREGIDPRFQFYASIGQAF